MSDPEAEAKKKAEEEAARNKAAEEKKAADAKKAEEEAARKAQRPQRNPRQIREAARRDEDLTDDEIDQLDAADKESYEAGRARQAEIAKIKDADERKILTLYERGVQNYEIARRVFKFVNQDTVGQVILIIRKHYADDYNKVEDVESTKGYSGVSK